MSSVCHENASVGDVLAFNIFSLKAKWRFLKSKNKPNIFNDQNML